MPGLAEPNWTLSADRKTIFVTFPTQPPVVLGLDAANVDQLLAGVGMMRAEMDPPVSPHLPVGKPVPAIADPRWHTEIDPLTDMSLLHLCDPRLGWLHYGLPKHEAAKLGQALLDQSQAGPSLSGTAS